MSPLQQTLVICAALFVIYTNAYTICNGNGEGCLLMRNVLRDPLRLSNWKTSSMNRAINQLQAYQQLFQEDKRSGHAEPHDNTPLIDM